ncbi:hypothetical protein RQP46_008643 [Phenoliferia psychrophenolica]
MQSNTLADPLLGAQAASDDRGYALIIEPLLASTYLAHSRSRNRYLTPCHADGCRKGLLNTVQQLALSDPIAPSVPDLLVQFLPEFSYELDAALFSALNLLTSSPLHTSHCLVIHLIYYPDHRDPSLVLQETREHRKIDLRDQIPDLHPSTYRAYTDPNWRENLKKRTSVSNTVFVSGTEPKMTEREVARFKGWW